MAWHKADECSRRLAKIGLDGTKIHANASRHSALSYERAGKIEAQLQAEVAELMAKAEAVDTADIPDGMSIPGTNWRGARSVCARSPKHARRSRRAPRNATRTMAEYQAKLAARDAKTAGHEQSLAASRHSLQPERGLCRAIRLISPTKTRASCRWREAASNSATTRKPPWRREVCWWLLSMWFRPHESPHF